MTPAETLSCFDWRPMESPPDPHDDVFVRYQRLILVGNFYGGHLYVQWRGRPVLILGKPLGWAPFEPDLTVTPEDIKVYC